MNSRLLIILGCALGILSLAVYFIFFDEDKEMVKRGPSYGGGTTTYSSSKDFSGSSFGDQTFGRPNDGSELLINDSNKLITQNVEKTRGINQSHIAQAYSIHNDGDKISKYSTTESLIVSLSSAGVSKSDSGNSLIGFTTGVGGNRYVSLSSMNQNPSGSAKLLETACLSVINNINADKKDIIVLDTTNQFKHIIASLQYIYGFGGLPFVIQSAVAYQIIDAFTQTNGDGFANAAKICSEIGQYLKNGVKSLSYEQCLKIVDEIILSSKTDYPYILSMLVKIPGFPVLTQSQQKSLVNNLINNLKSGTLNKEKFCAMLTGLINGALMNSDLYKNCKVVLEKIIQAGNSDVAFIKSELRAKLTGFSLLPDNVQTELVSSISSEMKNAKVVDIQQLCLNIAASIAGVIMGTDVYKACIKIMSELLKIPNVAYTPAVKSHLFKIPGFLLLPAALQEKFVTNVNIALTNTTNPADFPAERLCLDIASAIIAAIQASAVYKKCLSIIKDIITQKKTLDNGYIITKLEELPGFKTLLSEEQKEKYVKMINDIDLKVSDTDSQVQNICLALVTDLISAGLDLNDPYLYCLTVIDDLISNNTFRIAGASNKEEEAIKILKDGLRDFGLLAHDRQLSIAQKFLLAMEKQVSPEAICELYAKYLEDLANSSDFYQCLVTVRGILSSPEYLVLDSITKRTEFADKIFTDKLRNYKLIDIKFQKDMLRLLEQARIDKSTPEDICARYVDGIDTMSDINLCIKITNFLISTDDYRNLSSASARAKLADSTYSAQLKSYSLLTQDLKDAMLAKLEEVFLNKAMVLDVCSILGLKQSAAEKAKLALDAATKPSDPANNSSGVPLSQGSGTSSFSSTAGYAPFVSKTDLKTGCDVVTDQVYVEFDVASKGMISDQSVTIAQIINNVATKTVPGPKYGYLMQDTFKANFLQTIRDGLTGFCACNNPNNHESVCVPSDFLFSYAGMNSVSNPDTGVSKCSLSKKNNEINGETVFLRSDVQRLILDRVFDVGSFIELNTAKVTPDKITEIMNQIGKCAYTGFSQTQWSDAFEQVKKPLIGILPPNPAQGNSDTASLEKAAIESPLYPMCLSALNDIKSTTPLMTTDQINAKLSASLSVAGKDGNYFDQLGMPSRVMGIEYASCYASKCGLGQNTSCDKYNYSCEELPSVICKDLLIKMNINTFLGKPVIRSFDEMIGCDPDRGSIETQTVLCIADSEKYGKSAPCITYDASETPLIASQRQERPVLGIEYYGNSPAISRVGSTLKNIWYTLIAQKQSIYEKIISEITLLTFANKEKVSADECMRISVKYWSDFGSGGIATSSDDILQAMKNVITKMTTTQQTLEKPTPFDKCYVKVISLILENQKVSSYETCKNLRDKVVEAFNAYKSQKVGSSGGTQSSADMAFSQIEQILQDVSEIAKYQDVPSNDTIRAMGCQMQLRAIYSISGKYLFEWINDGEVLNPNMSNLKTACSSYSKNTTF